eukprot:5504873-Prymnesium_polylepis.1
MGLTQSRRPTSHADACRRCETCSEPSRRSRPVASVLLPRAPARCAASSASSRRWRHSGGGGGRWEGSNSFFLSVPVERNDLSSGGGGETTATPCRSIPIP